MAKDSSFDIVSDYDLSEMINAIDQVSRELVTRYDFAGTGSKAVFQREKNLIEIESNSELKLETIIDVIESKLLKRGISLKVLDKSGEVQSGNMIYRKTLPLIHGLDQDKAKRITKLVREHYPKVKTQIQGDVVRVSSSSKNDLQGVMAVVRQADFDFPIDFTNYR